MATVADLNKLKVPELKQALKDKGLPVSGSKAELVKRLAEANGAAVDTSSDGLDDSLQGIDDILSDDPVSTSKPDSSSAPVLATAKPTAAPEIKAAAAAAVQTPDTGSTNGAVDKEDGVDSGTASSSVAGKPALVAKLSEAERLKLRAEKFGVVSVDAKKELRAQRFGITSTGGDSSKFTADELERMKKRADRFGTVTSTSLNQVDEEERKRKRAERFGASSSSPSSAPAVKAVDSVKVASSTDSSSEAKRKRAERFGIAT